MQTQLRFKAHSAAASRRAVKAKAVAAPAKPAKGLDTDGKFINERKNCGDLELGPLVRPGLDDGTIRQKQEAMIRKAQLEVCAAIEKVDGGAKFRTDAWQRNNGGGGITKVLQNGKVWEKAGVAVSVVYGQMPVAALKSANPKAMLPKDIKPGQTVGFFAAGISSVMHPWNPHCPTMHFNYRYFETEESEGLPSQWWFGGGTDITPSYLVPEDLKHFHGTYKAVCDKHDPAYYPRFKADCDEYFHIKHRGETRGMGGIFYEGLNDKSQDQIFEFSKDCAAAIVPAYCPIIEKHKDDPFTKEQKEWQQMRRGRYVEYNLVYDRGTIFGLQTGGRVESILMSMPLTARWEYDYEPAAGTPEAEFLAAVRNPSAYNWV